MQMHKKGQTGGLVTGLVFGIVGLIIGVIVAFLIISVLTNSGILPSNSAGANSTNFLAGNFSTGINSIAGYIPTILLVAGIVLILGVLAVLVGIWSKMRMGGGI